MVKGEPYREYELGVRLTMREMEVRYYDAYGAVCTREEFQADTTGQYRRNAQWANNGMTIEDTVELGKRSFIGVMRVMTEMHEAIEDVRDAADH